MEKDIKIKKIELAIYPLAVKLGILITRFDWGKRLRRLCRGIYEEHIYEDIFYLFIAKSILNFALALILTMLMIFLAGFSKGILLLCLSIITILSILPFSRIKREYQENEFLLDEGIENLVHELAILLASGMSLDSAIWLKRTDRKTDYVMLKFFKYLQDAKKRGLNINSAILAFSKIYQNKYLNKLNVIISQSKKKGTGKQADALIQLGKEIMNERKNKIKKKAETMSTKMLMPLMVSMLGIIVMIMVPIFMQF